MLNDAYSACGGVEPTNGAGAGRGSAGWLSSGGDLLVDAEVLLDRRDALEGVVDFFSAAAHVLQLLFDRLQLAME